ncbi:MAG TPA: hypothetical protein VJT67_10680 [Longimicrobiaceae bacterium]|nr:hypothetical protein [Longimicrobiaceae bacterium]
MIRWRQRRPKPGPAALLAAAATVSLVLLYWLLAALYHPGEPARVSVLYRFYDSDYLPAIYGLAHGQFGEVTDPVTRGQGLLPFPPLMMLPHALGVGLLGDYGFAAGDVAVALLHLLLAWHVARLFVAHRGLRAATAFLMVVAMFPGDAWGFRYPRPFVTHLFLLAMAVLGARVWTGLAAGRTGRRDPLLLGLVAGAAAQGDVHGAAGYGAAIAALYGAWIYLRGRPAREELAAPAWTAGGFALGAVPVLVHARYASDELLARWGMYPVARGQTTIQVSTAVLLVFVLAVLAVLLRLRTIRPGDPRAARETGLMAMLLCLCFGAVAAGPLSTWLLGEQIQVYQFQVRFGNVAQLSLLVAGWSLVCHAGRRSPRVLMALALLACAPPLGLMLKSIHAQARMERQPRLYPGHAALPGYRRDVAGLFRELRKPAYRGRDVLGTFDHELAMLWATEGKRTLFVPDPFLSKVPDREIESRTIALARLMGLDAPRFVEQAKDAYFQKRFLTLARWQLSRSYAAADLADYDAGELRAGFAGGLKANFNVALPLSEQRRLLRRFGRAQPPPLAPDLVILSTVARVPARDPGPPYALAYANATFRVFVRAAPGR